MVSPVYIRPLLALLVAMAIIAIVTVVIRDSPHDPVPVQSADRQLPRNIDVSLKKARFSEIQNGLVEWGLVAERADYDKKGDTAYLTDIRMEFYRNPSHGTITATADNGEYLSTEKTVRLKGHVHVVTENGASFTTSSIVYTGATDCFTTADPVVFRQQRLQLTAVGMELGVKNQRARFYSMIDAVLIPR